MVLLSCNVPQDKDSKIAFLQKAIDVVALVSGEPLAVRPARVVAGHEAEKTNELLQAIGRCCLSKVSSVGVRVQWGHVDAAFCVMAHCSVMTANRVIVGSYYIVHVANGIEEVHLYPCKM